MAENVEYHINLKDADFAKGMNNANASAGQLDGKMKGLNLSTSTLTNAVKGLGVAFGAMAIINYGKGAVAAFQTAGQANAQLKAGIESTNGAAGMTFEELTKQAEEFAQVSLLDDDKIKDAQAQLLTFTNVTKDNFKEATQAALNMSAKNGSDVSSAALMIGKALNNPAEGLSKLTKLGVEFTVEQEAQIKAMVASGDVIGAQSIMLKELQTEFGGAAKAASEAEGSGLIMFQKRMDEVQESIGGMIVKGLDLVMPAMNSFAEAVEGTVSFLREYSAEIKGLAIGYATYTGIMLVYNGVLAASTFISAANLAITKGITTASFLQTGAIAGLSLAQKLYSVITGQATMAQVGLNLAMSINPAVAIAGGIAILVAGVVIAWNKFEGFRGAILGVWEVLKSVGSSIGAFFEAVTTGDFSKMKGIELTKSFDVGFKGGVDDFRKEKADKESKNTPENAQKAVLLAQKENKIDSVGELETVIKDLKTQFKNETDEKKRGEIKGKINDFQSQLDKMLGKSLAKNSGSGGMGTGTKIVAAAPQNFYTNIGSVVKDFNIKTESLNNLTFEQIRNMVGSVLMSAVNDSQRIAGVNS